MSTKTKYWSYPRNRDLVTGFYVNPDEEKKFMYQSVLIPSITLYRTASGRKAGQL